MIKFGIDSSPPRRVQPALPTSTQGEEGKQHGVGVPLRQRSSERQWRVEIASENERLPLRHSIVVYLVRRGGPGKK